MKDFAICLRKNDLFFRFERLCNLSGRKNGKCKKNGRRRREDDEESSDMICIIRAGYNVVNAFEKEPIKDCFIDHFEENF